MEIGSPEWIQASLENLEVLEQERDEHEAALEEATDADALRVHSEAIDRLDDEIKTLYAQLESVAEDEDDEPASVASSVRTAEFRSEEEDPADPAEPVAATPVAAEPAAAEPEASPFGGAPSSPPAEPAPSMTTSSSFDASTDTSYDFDPPAKGGAGKWIVVALLVLGAAGGGGWYYMNKIKAPEPAATQDPGPTQVIKAAAVPEDTEEPNFAKGKDGATSTPTQDFSKGGKRRGGSGGGGGGGGGGGSKGKGKGKSGHSISIAGGDDPI
jgi:hypothetical protein